MNLLHIINRLVIGGAERILIDSIAGFKKYWPESKHHLLVLYENSGQIKESELDFESVNFLNSSFFRLPLQLRKVKKIITSKKIDVVHSHLYDSNIFSRFLRVNRIINSYHSTDYSPLALHHSKWRILIDRISYSENHIPIYVSNSVQEAVQNQIPNQKKNGRVLVNFCREDFTNSWKLSQSSKLKLVSVGTLRKAKNYHLLTNVFQHLRDCEIELDIYGDGELYSELNLIIQKNNLKINLKGSSIITSELLSQYDIYINTSIIEGMPVSVIEAMTSGLPLILPNYLPVMREIAGERAKYFDDEYELTETIKYCFFNKSSLSNQSDDSNLLIEKYSLQNYIGNLKNIYHQR